MQRPHDPGRRGGMAHAGPGLVVEQQLPAPHALARLHMEGRLEPDLVSPQQADAADPGGRVNHLLGVAGQRQVEAALEPMRRC